MKPLLLKLEREREKEKLALRLLHVTYHPNNIHNSYKRLSTSRLIQVVVVII